MALGTAILIIRPKQIPDFPWTMVCQPSKAIRGLAVAVRKAAKDSKLHLVERSHRP